MEKIISTIDRGSVDMTHQEWEYHYDQLCKKDFENKIYAKCKKEDQEERP